MHRKFTAALAVLIVYMAIIIIGPKFQIGTEHVSLSELTSQQIMIPLVVALGFLLFSTAIGNLWKDVGLKLPRSAKSLLIVWLPAIFIIGFFSVALMVGTISRTTVFYVGINTLLVGITEELAFRGILFCGARSQFRIWGAIAFTTIVFGAVHALNGFTTGDFLSSSVQAIAAGMSGLLFLAILLRTGSIIPGMIVHWLWDFGLFSMLSAGEKLVEKFSASSEPSTPLIAMIFPVLFVLPNFLYALWLLRKVGTIEGEVI